MTHDRAAGHAIAEAVYTEHWRGNFPAWPAWEDLRLRTRDMIVAAIHGITYDRDKPVVRRMAQVAPEPRPMALAAERNGGAHGRAEPPSRDPDRYSAGSEVDPASVLLGEAGFKPG